MPRTAPSGALKCEPGLLPHGAATLAATARWVGRVNATSDGLECFGQDARLEDPLEVWDIPESHCFEENWRCLEHSAVACDITPAYGSHSSFYNRPCAYRRDIRLSCIEFYQSDVCFLFPKCTNYRTYLHQNVRPGAPRHTGALEAKKRFLQLRRTDQ